MNLPGKHARMVHEVAANQIIIISKAIGPDLIRSEQEPRILDSTRGKHKNFRRGDNRAPGQRFHLHRADRLIGVALNVNGIGVEIHADSFRFRELVAVKSAEARGRAELRDPGNDSGCVQRDRLKLPVTDRIDPKFDVVPVWTELENAVTAATLSPR
jgi:hypothetical protein